MNTIKWLSPHTLAQRWGVSRETVLRLIARGELPALKVNARVIRISEADAAVGYIRRYVKRSDNASLSDNSSARYLSDNGKTAA